MRLLILPLVLLILMGFTYDPNQKDEVVQNFSLVNAIDQNTVSLSDFEKSKAVVVIFSSPSCAFSKIYEDRVLALANEFKNKEVSFILINPNNPVAHPEDNRDAMIERAKMKGYSFPFLVDENHKIATQFGAEKTPEVFVLKSVNKSFIQKYKGAIDDNPQMASEVTCYYLKDAINAVIANTPVKIVEKKATGCMIKK